MSLGPMEIGVLLLLLFFVFGPRRITQLGKSFGKALTGYQKASHEDGTTKVEKKA